MTVEDHNESAWRDHESDESATDSDESAITCYESATVYVIS